MMTTFSPPHPSPSFSRLLSLYLSHPPTLPPYFSICLLQHTCLSFLFTLIITITHMFIHSPILLCVFLQTKKVYEMETPEKLEQAEIRKAKGTDFFKVNWFEKNILFCFLKQVRSVDIFAVKRCLVTRWWSFQFAYAVYLLIYPSV